MTEFEKAKHVRACLASRAMEPFIYKSWSDSFARENAADSIERLKSLYRGISVTGFTQAECLDLDFALWDKTGLRMVPVWLYPFLRYGDELTSISGDKVVVQKGYDDRANFSRGEDGSKTGYYIDNDHRGGALAFGFVPYDFQPAAVE